MFLLLSLHQIREARVTQITAEKIKIVRLREELVFEVDTAGLYVTLDGKKVTVNNTGKRRLLFLCWFDTQDTQFYRNYSGIVIGNKSIKNGIHTCDIIFDQSARRVSMF